jgi:hypothetical protein
MMRQMEQKLQYLETYLELLNKCKDAVVVANVCGLVKALVHAVSGM